MTAPKHEFLKRQSKGCALAMSSIDEDVSAPTEDLVDSALVKSANLIGELAKLGISLDSDDISDGASTCSGLPSSASANCSSSDADDESGSEGPRSSSLSSLAHGISKQEQNTAKLLSLKEKLRALKECRGQDDSSIIKQSSEAILRLEAHLQGLTKAAEASNNSETRLQRLEEVVGQIKKSRKSLCSTTRPSIAARSPSPVSVAMARSPSPVSVATTHPPRATQRASPMRPRNLSPSRAPAQVSRATLPASVANPKRLFCQQVAVTQVYNVWTLRD